MTIEAKTLRAPPDRNFDNYVLTRVVSPNVGPTGIHESRFTHVLTGLDPAGGGVSPCGGISEKISIGFDFQIDGITYKEIAISTYGSAILIDPTNDDYEDVFIGGTSNSYYANGLINTPVGFTNNHI